MKTFFLILGLVVVLVAAGTIGYLVTKQPAASPTPTPNSSIVVDQPIAGAQVSSPLHVTGKARGTWYFEAVFPVVLTDWDGRIIAQTQAQAQGDWMTTDFVPFTATLTFQSPTASNSADYAKRGFLILKKDNPSGKPMTSDDSIEIPVVFK